jgi:hypothetical protein
MSVPREQQQIQDLGEERDRLGGSFLGPNMLQHPLPRLFPNPTLARGGAIEFGVVK